MLVEQQIELQVLRYIHNRTKVTCPSPTSIFCRITRDAYLKHRLYVRGLVYRSMLVAHLSLEPPFV